MEAFQSVCDGDIVYNASFDVEIVADVVPSNRFDPLGEAVDLGHNRIELKYIEITF